MRYGDVTDFSNVFNLIDQIKPDEIYNLAAQSNVGVSFELAEYTAQTDSIGTLRILEAIRIIDKKRKIKFYQASTSEIFGNSPDKPYNEKVGLNQFHLTELQNYILTGLLEITEKHILYMLLTAFYLITSHLEEVKILFLEKQS